jgi:FAD/FMN-containing dehydrogenase
MKCGIPCNDIHSRLNPVTVADIARPTDTEEVAGLLRGSPLPVSICGARHAMGGQQFGEGTLLLDASGLKSVGPLDARAGLVEAGAGITWPDLIDALQHLQPGRPDRWTIRQKQTGADRLTLGGALAANIHGRGLTTAPLIGDVEAFTLVDAAGRILRCSRTENARLFRHAIGGYGCFGVITSVQLRLTRRRTLRRLVEITTVDRLNAALDERVAAGCLYGDFQFAIDARSPDFLHRGVLSTYRPVPDDTPPTPTPSLRAEDWKRLIHLAHTDPTRGFEEYAAHYLRTHGSLHGSDTHQLGIYLDDYHRELDACTGMPPGTEMITELYVPRDLLPDFMSRAADLLRPSGVPVIYGTVRRIQQDHESALPWARGDFACIIFNLHTEHSLLGMATSARAFRGLIDLALALGGSYYLTYHRWARRDQVERGHPTIEDFIREKWKHDPTDRFQSDWWRHHRDLLRSQ